MNFQEGIDAIWRDDEEIQLALLEELFRSTRNIPEEFIKTYTEYCRGMGMFFVIDDKYMKKYFSPQIVEPKYGLYQEFKYCTLYERLAIPLRWLDGEIFGFCGYSITGDEDTKYLYPPKRVFNKDRFLFIEREEMVKAITDGYIFIVDGIFDKISLTVQGYNAVCLGSSYLTLFHREALNTIKHKIIVPDNDSAGKSLSKMGKRYLRNCITLTQSKEWDIDDYLKQPDNMSTLSEAFMELEKEGFLLDKHI